MIENRNTQAFKNSLSARGSAKKNDISENQNNGTTIKQV
jgi:hypothetical protein